MLVSQVTGNTAQFLQYAPIQIPFCVSVAERRKALRERVQRHTDHLEALVQTLKKLGVGEPAIKQHVADISKKYQSELLRHIDRI
jgi:hypothetical protein